MVGQRGERTSTHTKELFILAGITVVQGRQYSHWGEAEQVREIASNPRPLSLACRKWGKYSSSQRMRAWSQASEGKCMQCHLATPVPI